MNTKELEEFARKLNACDYIQRWYTDNGLTFVKKIFFTETQSLYCKIKIHIDFIAVGEFRTKAEIVVYNANQSHAYNGLKNECDLDYIEEFAKRFTGFVENNYTN